MRTTDAFAAVLALALAHDYKMLVEAAVVVREIECAVAGQCHATGEHVL